MDQVAALEQKKKKELATVDHSKIEYRPYRKNFYVEVPELARMTPEGMNLKSFLKLFKHLCASCWLEYKK